MSKTKNKKEAVAKNSLQIRDFSMAFGDNILFSHFDYDFEPGIYGFSGPSGVGKSTLMRIIAGLEDRYTGDIILNGEKMTSYSPEIHMMPQHYTSFPWLNVLKNTLMVYKGHQVEPTAEDIEEAKQVLKELGLEEHLEKLPSQISGGQDQRLSLASVFVNKWSKVILYDEPTSALDNLNDMIVVDMIKRHQKKYGTIEIIITHEEHVLEGLGAKILDFTPEFRLHPPKEVAVEPVASETEVESNETVPSVVVIQHEIMPDVEGAFNVEVIPKDEGLTQSEAVSNAEVVAESEGTVVEENELPKEGAPPITAEGVTKNGEEVEVAGA